MERRIRVGELSVLDGDGLPGAGELGPAIRRRCDPVDLRVGIRPTCRIPPAVRACGSRTKNAPEWFRGVGFALAFVARAYGSGQLSDRFRSYRATAAMLLGEAAVVVTALAAALLVVGLVLVAVLG
ncbi:hypothetical protein, partial [uncultured Senegalimassilia sp.]|uniref:hypothetical protein n=1 Tax=uncultured Senegalimassilia sp. TaxID=1714350 RepID=UPI0025F2E424